MDSSHQWPAPERLSPRASFPSPIIESLLLEQSVDKRREGGGLQEEHEQTPQYQDQDGG